MNNKTIYLLSFVETPRKFIIAELSIRMLGSSSVLIIRLFEFTRPFLYIKCRDCILYSPCKRTRNLIKQLLNSVLVGYEELLRPRFVLSASAFGFGR